MSTDAPWRCLANRSQGARAVGGSLAIEEGEIRFTPNFFDIRLGGKRWSAPLESVVSIGKEPASWTPSNLFSGGLRARLRLELADGSHELFVVNKLDQLIDELRALRSA